MLILPTPFIHANAKRVLKQFTPRAIILMYHRVAEAGIDPWSLCVTPQHFEEHLRILQRWTTPVSLQHLVQTHQANCLPDRAVAITFDDGYANNLHFAKPILERYGIPATVFVTTGYSQRHREFWWDELEQLLLQPGQLPEALCFTNGDRCYEIQLGTAAKYTPDEVARDRTQAVWTAPPGSRLAFYYTVWQQLQPLPDPERQSVLDQIRVWAGVSPQLRSTHRPMTHEEVCTLEADGLIEVGAHTVNHPLLPTLPLQAQQVEIQQSKVILETLLGHSITSFAYPFGGYDATTLSLVQQAGFLCACTTVDETVWPRSDCFQLPRFNVQNWSGTAFKAQLHRWFRR